MYTIHTAFYEGYARGTWRMLVFMRDAHERLKEVVCEIGLAKDRFTYDPASRRLVFREKDVDGPILYKEIARKMAEAFTNHLEISTENPQMRTTDWSWNKKHLDPRRYIAPQAISAQQFMFNKSLSAEPARPWRSDKVKLQAGVVLGNRFYGGLVGPDDLQAAANDAVVEGDWDVQAFEGPPRDP